MVVFLLLVAIALLFMMLCVMVGILKENQEMKEMLRLEDLDRQFRAQQEAKRLAAVGY